LRELNLQPLPPRSTHCVSKIAERIGISGKTQGRAIEILYQAREKRLDRGKGPMGIAAGALYIACELNNESINFRGHLHLVTQADIAKAAGVTEVTVRNRYKELKEKLGIRIPTKSEKFALFLCMRKA
jgi:transcription initiation factor TFIIB